MSSNEPLLDLSGSTRLDLPRRRAGACRRVLVRAALLGSVALGGLGSEREARAEAPGRDSARAVQLNEAGSELYVAGNYVGALQAFERAYALSSEPNLLFNIAGCYQRLGQSTRAIEYYRWFLNAPQADSEGRRRAIQALGELERPAPQEPRPADADAKASAHPGWPLATLGAGILFAGLGAGLYLDGAHDHTEVTTAPGFGDSSGANTMTEVEARELIESGDTKKLVGAIGFGLGGALITTHLVFSLWRSSRSESSPVQAELRLTPNGCALTGKF